MDGGACAAARRPLAGPLGEPPRRQAAALVTATTAAAASMMTGRPKPGTRAFCPPSRDSAGPPVSASRRNPPKVQPGDPPRAYDIYGPRVRAVVVSSYAAAAAVTSVVHDRTSVLATVEAKWNLPAPTDRDANGHDVMDFLDLSLAPRTGIKVQAPSDTGPSGPIAPT